MGVHWSPVDSTHKGVWRGALVFSLTRAWIIDWLNNRDAGDLRHHSVYYYVNVMSKLRTIWAYKVSTVVDRKSHIFLMNNCYQIGIGFSQCRELIQPYSFNTQTSCYNSNTVITADGLEFDILHYLLRYLLNIITQRSLQNLGKRMKMVLSNAVKRHFYSNMTIWRHKSGTTLAPVMACCLTAQSHYLNHCWPIVGKVS